MTTKKEEKSRGKWLGNISKKIYKDKGQKPGNYWSDIHWFYETNDNNVVIIETKNYRSPSIRRDFYVANRKKDILKRFDRDDTGFVKFGNFEVRGDILHYDTFNWWKKERYMEPREHHRFVIE